MLCWVLVVNFGGCGHDKNPGMAAEFEVSKHSTCHDVQDDCVWEDHYKSNRILWRNRGSKKRDECCEVKYDSDTNTMTPVRRKHQECG